MEEWQKVAAELGSPQLNGQQISVADENSLEHAILMAADAIRARRSLFTKMIAFPTGSPQQTFLEVSMKLIDKQAEEEITRVLNKFGIRATYPA